MKMVLNKMIVSPMEMQKWTSSSAYKDILSLIKMVNSKVISRSILSDLCLSSAIRSTCDLLDFLKQKIAEFPPEQQTQRFGNKSFRLWFAWLSDNSSALCKRFLIDQFAHQPPINDDLIQEVSKYLVESVGNSTRIDYGTGHELAFIAFLSCLFKLNILEKNHSPELTTIDDYTAIGLAVMPNYLSLVRQLQTEYRMEPAGSHGVWCLDDFHFVPYIWGSNQLIEHPTLKPIDIPNRQIAEREKNTNLLFSCISYIYQCKTGLFEEHSNVLYSISQLPRWQKVNSGLLKMYEGEVLNKFPVIQHFLFGELLRLGP